MAKIQYYRTQTAADRALMTFSGTDGNAIVQRTEIESLNRKLRTTLLMALREFKYGDSTKDAKGNIDTIYLTETGKERLHQLKEGDGAVAQVKDKPISDRSREITFISVKEDVEILKKRNPGLKIVFTVELDEEAPMKQG